MGRGGWRDGVGGRGSAALFHGFPEYVIAKDWKILPLLIEKQKDLKDQAGLFVLFFFSVETFKVFTPKTNLPFCSH